MSRASGTPGDTPPHPIIAALLEGRAAAPLRLAAARGALPIPRHDLVRVLVHLLDDPGDDVRRQAGDSLAAISEEDLLQILADPATSVEVLDHFGSSRGTAAIRSAVMAHPSTPNETLCRMAPSLSASQIDDLLLNQARLIEAPKVLELLALNPATTALQRTRFEEIRRHFLSPSGPVRAADAPTTPPSPHDPGGAEPVVAEEFPEAEVETVAESMADEPEEDGESASRIEEAATMRIQRLTTAEKVKLAFKASREERSILIRDTSRSVQTAVLECPMLSEPEVERFARMRTMSEDVLRHIASHKTWMKNYKIAYALSTNPKTPIRIAMTLIQRLHSRDLKVIVTDKNLPEAVRRHARKVVEARNKRQGG